MGIIARAALTQSKVIEYRGKWDAALFVEAFRESRSRWTALVPTQMVDIVKLGLVAPAHHRGVIIGGGSLSEDIVKKSIGLGWRVLQSYGMSEVRNHARKAVFTSYMEHPLGQAFAAYEAGRAMQNYMGLVDVGGLMTHGLFEPTAFTEALGKPNPQWMYQDGTGLGFDHQLEALEWKRLN